MEHEVTMHNDKQRERVSIQIMPASLQQSFSKILSGLLVYGLGKCDQRTSLQNAHL